MTSIYYKPIRIQTYSLYPCHLLHLQSPTLGLMSTFNPHSPSHFLNLPLRTTTRTLISASVMNPSFIRPPIRAHRPSTSQTLLAKANGNPTIPPILVPRSIRVNCQLTAASPSNLVAFSVRLRHSHVIGTIGLHINTRTISNRRRASTMPPISVRFRVAHPHGTMASTRARLGCPPAIRPMTPSMSR